MIWKRIAIAHCYQNMVIIVQVFSTSMEYIRSCQLLGLQHDAQTCMCPHSVSGITCTASVRPSSATPRPLWVNRPRSVFNRRSLALAADRRAQTRTNHPYRLYHLRPTWPPRRPECCISGGFHPRRVGVGADSRLLLRSACERGEDAARGRRRRRPG